MAKYPLTILFVSAMTAGSMLVGSAQQSQPSVLPMGPQRERGASITPAFEGWYKNDDGSFSILVGYYNRNTREPLTIPIGPNNKIEPGDPDQGQPTFFETGRQWGVFVLKVPKDFGTKSIKWTITSNGETQSIPFTLNPGYPITPYKELGMLNEPPVLKFAADGPKFSGPPLSVATTLTGTTGQPVPIQVWATDVKERGKEEGAAMVANLSFHKYRGPGDVKFDPVRVSAKQPGAMVSSNATFSAPGEYWLRVQANDESGEGGGGFQCCWTNAYVKVSVK